MAGSAFGWHYLFQGGRLDAASGLTDFQHRDYSPTLSRWLELDPLRYRAGDVNLYRFVRGRPASGTDASGLRAPTLRQEFENIAGLYQDESDAQISELLKEKETDFNTALADLKDAQLAMDWAQGVLSGAIAAGNDGAACYILWWYYEDAGSDFDCDLADMIEQTTDIEDLSITQIVRSKYSGATINTAVTEGLKLEGGFQTASRDIYKQVVDQMGPDQRKAASKNMAVGDDLLEDIKCRDAPWGQANAYAYDVLSFIMELYAVSN